MYLTDTFVRAFGYPNQHLWNIGDLKCRLQSIHELIAPSDPMLNSTEAIVKALASVSKVQPPRTIPPNDGRQAAFQKASQAFCQAKANFENNGSQQYEWSEGNCTWQESPHSSIDECRNDDVLSYCSLQGRTTTINSLIITCWASLTEERSLITLAIGGCANGKMIRMPLGQYSTSQDYTNDVRESFKTELKNLLLAIYTEKQSNM